MNKMRMALIATICMSGVHAAGAATPGACAAAVVSVGGTQLSALPASALGELEKSVRQIALVCPSKVNVASYQAVQGTVLDLASKIPDNSSEMVYFMAAIRAISPVVFQAVRESEAVHGRPFATVAEAMMLTSGPEFKQRYQVALAAFCALPTNAASLDCVPAPAAK